jgi:NAD(P)-dependent dehydrogenase (short-subunit alcohol dehydrogenase family)
MRVLVTGGAGYIGSHTTLALLQAGHDVLVVDDLSNSSSVESLRRVADLSGRDPRASCEANVRDEAALDGAFASFAPDAVIHFAGWKAVGESTQDPAHVLPREPRARPSRCWRSWRKPRRADRIVFSEFGDRVRRAVRAALLRGRPDRRHQPLRPAPST